MSEMRNEKLSNELVIEIADAYGVSPKDVKLLIDKIINDYEIYDVKAGVPASTTGEATMFLFSKFSEAKIAAGINEKSIQQYFITVRSICIYTGKDINLTTTEDIRKFLAKCKAEGSLPSTLQNKYFNLSSFFSFLFNEGYVSENPMLKVEKPKAPINLKTPLTATEIETIRINSVKLKPKARARAMCMFYVLLYTGVRISESLNIKIGDIDFNKKAIKIRNGKGGKDRTVYFNDETKKRMEVYLTFRPGYTDEDFLFVPLRGMPHQMKKESGEHLINTLGEIAGVPRIHPHLLRATFATNLVNKGVNIQTVAKLLGHANLNTINRYVILADEDIEKAIR